MTTPLSEGMLATGDGHALRYAEYGSPDAPAAVVLHGGPGSGCNTGMLAWFDMSRQRVVLFDQRGAGASTPRGSLLHNTTGHLVADVERLRRHLHIEKWMVVGGSWGATLGLAYLGAHPQVVQALVLRGLFLPAARQLDWFFQSLQWLVPEGWAKMTQAMTLAERGSVLSTLSSRLLDGDAAAQTDAAWRWSQYEDAVMAAMRGQQPAESEIGERTVAKYRLQAHYLMHGCFVTERSLVHAARRNNVPILCLHGTRDWICPPANALRLKRLLPRIELRWIVNGSHAAADPLVSDALKSAVADVRQRYQS
jgi:proline iminopeptidase